MSELDCVARARLQHLVEAPSLLGSDLGGVSVRSEEESEREEDRMRAVEAREEGG